jgi:glycosyltransferase involved in cell wall biosynthesis
VDGLIGALAVDKDNIDLAVACQRADEERYGRLAPDATIAVGPVGLGHRTERLAWEQNGLPLVARKVGADVIHMPNYSMPLRAGMPTVVTIHDLSFFTDPERYTQVRGLSLKSVTRTSVREATRLIVPSNATRDDLVRVLGVDPAKIDVALHGVDHSVFRRPDESQVARITARLGLHGKPYVAYLGSLTPRKNAAALVTAWAMAVTDLPEPPALVLAGGGSASEQLEAAVERVPSHLRLIRPGYLPIGDLPGFLGGALVVAAPSRGEGFGLPVLEAMACGAPVLTTRLTSLPEVGGTAVAYTEPDAESIAAALAELLGNPSRRAELSEAGPVRAHGFTWAASASAHEASYKRAADNGAAGHR